GKDAVAKGGVDLSQPGFQCFRFHRIPAPSELNAFADFTEHEHAEIEVGIIDRRVPRCNQLIAARTLPDFGDNVRVDQVTHRSTARPVSRLRSRSTPSSGAAASNVLSP